LQIARRGLGVIDLQLLSQGLQFLLKPIYLLLLSEHRSVQLFQHIFGKAQLDFDFGEAGLHGISSYLIGANVRPSQNTGSLAVGIEATLTHSSFTGAAAGPYLKQCKR